MSKPKVTLITVSYNSENTIKDTIESVLKQDYEFIEYIIVDGASNDSTNKIIQSYQGHISKVISERDKGIYDAMNKGLRAATGDIIGIINSDDFYPENNIITKVVEKFESQPNAGLVLGSIDFVKTNNLNKSVRKYTSKNFSPWLMRFGIMPPHPAAFIKHDAYEKVGEYKLGYRIAADFDLLLRLLKIKKLTYSKIDLVCVRMRLGGVSTEGISSFNLISQELLQSLKENKVYSNSMFVLLRVFSKVKQLVFK